MISDFSYVIEESKQESPQVTGRQKAVDTENLDNSENIQSHDESHGWLKDHLILSPGRDRKVQEAEN